MQSKIDFLIQCNTYQASLVTTEDAKICDVNKCDSHNNIFVTDGVDNCVKCNVSNVDNNAVFENNANFLISSKHSVDKVSTYSININSSNGGASASMCRSLVLRPQGGIVRPLFPMLKRWPSRVRRLSEERFLFLDL